MNLTSKKSQYEMFVYYDFNYMTVFKMQNCGDLEKVNICQQLRGSEEQQSTGFFQGSENTLYDTGLNNNKPKEYTKPRVQE